MFAAEPSWSAADLGRRAADDLARGIVSGRVPPGAPLPKETELVKQLGISRATLRGGLQALESVGLITRVSGHGTYVRPYHEWAFLSPVLSRWISAFAPPEPPFLRDIFAFRLSIEPTIAAIAARAACGRDLQAMEEAFAGMAAHAFDPRDRDEQLTPFDQADLAFHRAIYRATGNLIWQQMTPIIEPAIRLVIHRSNAEADQLRATLANHEAMLTHIRRQDPARARAAAIHQLARTAEDLGIPLDGDELPPAPAAVVTAHIPAQPDLASQEAEPLS